MKLKVLLAASAVLLAGGTGAQAAQVAALTGDDTIVVVDTSLKKTIKSMADAEGAREDRPRTDWTAAKALKRYSVLSRSPTGDIATMAALVE